MKVLIIGANGYIGKETGICLARAGHTVYGLVRKEEYGKELLQHEIQPVIGDIADFKVTAPSGAQRCPPHDWPGSEHSVCVIWAGSGAGD